MYAIVGYFDEVTESMIVKLWEDLRDRAITDYPFRRMGHRPHLTFSSFPELNSDLLQKLEPFADLSEALPLRFRLFGSFIKSDSFLLLPDPSSLLSEFQREVYALQAASSLYSPEKWIPHVTIANHLNLDQQSAVQHLAKKRLEPFSGTLSKIALIQITEHAVIELQLYSL
ncbi:2'-5' RNA ligase family protein [Terribacillus saccharophilus]|uniref:2'-5' RNA ligase superfamily protein n=1 Tax=Terribacillus saccharophilus TaxID=361277 RepID=A0ABX4H129_9BACI|nr:2'-5' RNA ligase family protein [Terribacillus saccharophilus]PAD36439.1 hypothetical protein CHH56_04345 [Terribacillus saccharophilus]PAD97103.1 hypothetical protein CHH50_05020 [Terribacillus saccharophilus]PAE00851.1 hypothetical protein CHH48_05045 [Terribacillus saccharophilus]